MDQKEAAEPRVRPSSATRPSTRTGGRPCFSPSRGIACEIEFQKIKLDIFLILQYRHIYLYFVIID